MRRLALVVTAVVAGLAFSSCSQAGVSAADAYKIGCPAVDSALGGGTIVNKVSVTGLKALRDTNQLGPEAQAWLVAVIQTLESSKPEDMPADAKKLIVDGCQQNGYELQNI
ncbi:MAG TPA: hypothetical protein VIT42_12925 [Microlunatus sp.]